MRVFFDPNVLVSAFLARGLCSDLYEMTVTEHQLIVGAPVVTELERILSDKLKVPRALRRRVASELQRFEQAPATSTESVDFPPDRADEPILACALAAQAEVFVTGDKAVLQLGTLETMRIRTPRKVWYELTGFGRSEKLH